MFRIFNWLVCSVLVLASFSSLRGQNYSVYNSFYVNPYLYNPAEAATDYAYVFANYRRQWVGVQGAPSVSTLNLNTLIDQTRSGVGLIVSSYNRGLLKSTQGLVTFAHGVPLNKDNILFFGISGGLTSNSIDISQIEDLSDPALASYQANNLEPAANFGIKFTSASGIHLGAVLPKLLGSVINPSDLSTTGRGPFDNMIFTFSYKKKVDGGLVTKKRRGVQTRVKSGVHYAPLELHALYRYSSAGNNQFEVVAKFNLSDNFWLAGSYRQQYGFVAGVGFAFDQINLCYSYEPGGQLQKGFSSGGHEIQLGVRLSGEKRFKFSAPVLHSTLKTQEVHHDARFHQETIDEVVAAGASKPKLMYYVVVNSFTDFQAAEVFKKKLIEQKYNAQIYFSAKEKRFYVYTFASAKASEANEEVKNLKALTKLKGAKVITVQVK